MFREPTPITVMLYVLLENSEWIFGTYKLNVLTWLGLLLLCMIFYPCSYSAPPQHQALSQKFRQPLTFQLLFPFWDISFHRFCNWTVQRPRPLDSLSTSGLVWVLWHINHCRLFNAKSIFIHINSSISNNSVWHKYSFLFTNSYI